jgi:GDP-L-fucose synthase
LARNNNETEVVVWGDGLSLRNFLHVNDLATAVELRVRSEFRVENVINLAGEEEISIRELSEKIAEFTKYEGRIRFDKSKPNGARRKQLDDSYWRSFGWKPGIEINSGLKNYIESFEREL